MSIKSQIPRNIEVQQNIPQEEWKEFNLFKEFKNTSTEELEKFKLFKAIQDKRVRDDTKLQRERSDKYDEWQIRAKERQIKFKKDQIKQNQSVETMSIRNEKTGLNHGYVDGLKPIWYLQNEIEMLELEIEQHKELIKQRKLAREEDKDVFAD